MLSANTRPISPLGLPRCRAIVAGSSLLRSTIVVLPVPRITLEEDAEVLVEEDVGVEDDRAPGHLPRAVRLAQHILAATGKELMIRLQVRAVHQKRGLGLDLA